MLVKLWNWWECECFLAIFGVPFRIGGMAAVLEFDQINEGIPQFSPAVALFMLWIVSRYR